MTAVSLMLAAWVIEAVFGWPDWLYRLVRHPVVWFGALVRLADRTLNHASWPHALRYTLGAMASLASIALVTWMSWLLSRALPQTAAGFIIKALLASSLLASRSLFQHVARVAHPLTAGDLPAARIAVSFIVGRDPASLDEAAIARASLESLAENASDGVIAPLFWGAIFGLPGLAAYKAINTLDSMVGHRTDRHTAFGGFAARLDDAANLIPARLTGALLACASLRRSSFGIMFRDARRHRSPNAGWPEAAMAGALGIRLSGPRVYGDRASDEPWLNAEAGDPGPDDVNRGLRLYLKGIGLGAALLASIALLLEAP